MSTAYRPDFDGNARAVIDDWDRALAAADAMSWEGNGMATATATSDTVLAARNCLRSLELAKKPGMWPSTVAETVDDCRAVLAERIATDRTGVTSQQARLTALYSRSQLSDRQVEASKLYASAYWSALRELPNDLDGLIAHCRVLAGIDYPARQAAD